MYDINNPYSGYIGRTVQHPDRRLYEHTSPTDNKKLQHWIEEAGVDNISGDIIEHNTDMYGFTLKRVDNRETFWIRYFSCSTNVKLHNISKMPYDAIYLLKSTIQKEHSPLLQLKAQIIQNIIINRQKPTSDIEKLLEEKYFDWLNNKITSLDEVINDSKIHLELFYITNNLRN